MFTADGAKVSDIAHLLRLQATTRGSRGSLCSCTWSVIPPLAAPSPDTAAQLQRPGWWGEPTEGKELSISTYHSCLCCLAGRVMLHSSLLRLLISGKCAKDQLQNITTFGLTKTEATTTYITKGLVFNSYKIHEMICPDRSRVALLCWMQLIAYRYLDYTVVD